MSSVYFPSMIKKLEPVIGYFQEAEDILNLEPAKARVHILGDRARQRKEEAKELMRKLQNEAAKMK